MQKYNIVFLDTSTMGDIRDKLSIFNQFGVFKSYEFTNSDEVLERIADADIVITNKVVISEYHMEHSSKLKLICVSATGMNNVDLEGAQKRQIKVMNAVNYSSNSVAQHTFAMLLSLLHQIRYYDDFVKDGLYSRESIFTHIGSGFFELQGKVFGILGLGNIGQRTAKIAEGFGCKVIYYSTSGVDRTDQYERVSLDELLKQSDIISVHAPLDLKTENLIGEIEIAKMKPSAFLINTGRGGIINEEELVISLDNDEIAGAAIDVFSKEPMPIDHPYLQIKRKNKLLLSPHVAWASGESRSALIDRVVSNIESFVNHT